jgi:UDP-glucuronate 4-epimerase
MPILLTGAAGFIGFHTTRRLLARGEEVVGIDDFNDYYDPRIKEARAAILEKEPGFRMVRMQCQDREGIAALFKDNSFDRVIHLAAQAGVRYSIENPFAYIDSNIIGFMTILEGCRHNGIKHLVYASSSSVYGGNRNLPFSINDSVDHPMSLYAATKKSNESMAHTYSSLYDLPTTGLRFFTVYGPWGRPDMALFLFTKAILEGETLPVFNNGRHSRDFTYVDDIVEGILKTLDHPAEPNPEYDPEDPDPGTSSAPWRVYNIGGGHPVELLRYIEVIEETVGRKAKLEMLPMQPGDVPDTCAAVEALMNDVGYRPSTTVEEGIPRFVEWYRDYYGV